VDRMYDHVAVHSAVLQCGLLSWIGLDWIGLSDWFDPLMYLPDIGQ